MWARRACSHLHTLPVLWLSQSPVEEAPVSLSQSSPSTLSLAALSSLHRCSFSASTSLNHPTSRCSPSNSRFLSQSSREREKPKKRKLTRRPNWAHACGRGKFRGLVLGGPFSGVILNLAWSRCLILSLLIYHVWTYSCSSGLDSKQIAEAEGL